MPNARYTRTFVYKGHRYYAYGNTVEEAIAARERKRIAVEQGDHTRCGVTLREWTQAAIETYKANVSDARREEIAMRLNKHLLSDLGSYALDKITPFQLQAVMNRQKGMSKSHIAKLSQDMFFVFDCARKNGMIQNNPAADLVRPQGTANKRRAITPFEREHLEKVLPSDDRFVFFSLMLYCGCRPSEAANVRYEDVIEKNGVHFLHIRGTKTANSDRLVPIPEEVYPIIVKRDSRGFCAVTAAGTKHNRSSYLRMVSSLKRALNISMGAKLYRNEIVEPVLADDFVPYLLRHTYCTDLKKKGIDVRIAKELMGHADIRTTANIYDHGDDETLMLAAELLGCTTHVQH